MKKVCVSNVKDDLSNPELKWEEAVLKKISLTVNSGNDLSIKPSDRTLTISKGGASRISINFIVSDEAKCRENIIVNRGPDFTIVSSGDTESN